MKNIAVFLVFGTAALAVVPLLNAGGPGTSPSALTAHEWGTFTSLQDSNGESLEGLQHTDEALPAFVHSRGQAARAQLQLSLASREKTWEPVPDPTPAPCRGKDCDFTPAAGTPLAVTQKMETPVIYFYSDHEQDVRVNVGFPGGLITQWFPAAQSFQPPAGQVGNLADGQTQWNVHVTPFTGAPVGPAIPPGSIWAPSREVPADTVTVGGESDRFIFYRGLGRFTTPVKIRSAAGQGLRIENGSDQSVADAFLIRVDAGRGSIRSLGEIAARGALTVDTATVNQIGEAMDDYLTHSASLIEAALARSGLTLPESAAMVNTWRTSYFRTPGLRVLYILPRTWTDQLLPLDISPAPQSLVRTLVGRIEVMTADEENNLLDELTQMASAPAAASPDAAVQSLIASLGRFAEPKLRRELELARDRGANSSTLARISGLIDLANGQD